MKQQFLILFSCSSITVIFAQGSWIQRADFGGAVRDGAVGFSIGSKGYIGTGVDNSSNFYYQDFWEYDPVTNFWTQKADFGGGKIAGAVGFSISNKGYVGTGASSSSAGDKGFWEYNPGLNQWTKKLDFGGTGRIQAVGFSIGNEGYIGTGRNGGIGPLKDFWRYDPVADSWTKKSDFGGTARNYSVGFAIAGKGYLGTGDDGTYKNDFWEYDTLTDTWSQKANFGGGARRAAVGFSIGSKGYVGTGEPALADFWEYNPSNNAWSQKGNFGGVGREFAVGFSIGNNGFIGTGLTGLPSLKDFWEFYSCSATPSICMVTVDSVSKNSVIMWDKTSYQHVDSFIVYREVGLNNYMPIGAVPYSSLSMCVDTVRTKYFPNTGNPNAGTYKYRLQIRDSCGELSPASLDHNTIFISNSNGTFSWPQLYLIGGSANPVSNYILMRDNNSNGNWIIVNSVAGSQQTVTDPQYATYQATASWRVETQWSISCNPSRFNSTAANFNSSLSNKFSLNPTGAIEYYSNSVTCIYPNPADGEITVDGFGSGVSSLGIYDVFGKLVFYSALDRKPQTVNPKLAGGMYFYKIINADEIISTGKLVIWGK